MPPDDLQLSNYKNVYYSNVDNKLNTLPSNTHSLKKGATITPHHYGVFRVDYNYLAFLRFFIWFLTHMLEKLTQSSP